MVRPDISKEAAGACQLVDSYLQLSCQKAGGLSEVSTD